MSRLRVINLSGCSSLSALPESIGLLEDLNELDLCGCSALQTLPESIGDCTTLSWLDMNRCASLLVLGHAFVQIILNRSTLIACLYNMDYA